MRARVSIDQTTTALQQLGKCAAPGEVLSNPEVWDRPIVQQFRDQTWLAAKSVLDKTQQEHDQLREHLQKIAQNIVTAVGRVSDGRA